LVKSGIRSEVGVEQKREFKSQLKERKKMCCPFGQPFFC